MFRKKNVILLGPLPPPYMGPSIATEIILNSSLREEFRLIHLDTSDHRELNTLGIIDFQNIFLALKHYLLLFMTIIRCWPDLVYIPISQTTVGYVRDAIFILISKMFRRKVVCHLRGGNFRNWYNSANVLIRWFVRNVHSLVDGQIVLGEKLRDLFKEILEEKKIFVVPNGKNIKFDNSKKRNSNKTKVLYLSNFIRSKGILDVINALPFVYNYDQNIEFIFAGSWRDKHTQLEFEKVAKKYQNSIRMIGPIYGENKYNLLYTADIFVYPTYYLPEGHPWVIVEAMSAGLPIITCDQGAITESVLDGKNGYIVPPRNPEQLAEKILKLIDDEETRKKMGEESRKHYLESLTEDKMVEKLCTAFNSILKN